MSKLKKYLKSKTFKDNLFCWSLIIYPITLFAIFWVGVNVNSILLAFRQLNADNVYEFVAFDNFKSFLGQMFGNGQDKLLVYSFRNSVISFVIGLVITYPLTLIFSFYIYKRFFGHNVFRMLIMIPTIVSAIIISMVFGKFVEGALPKIWAAFTGKDYSQFPQLLRDPKYTFGTMVFYSAWISFAVNMILYPNSMRAIPPEVIESAKLDGCLVFQEFWHIVLPLIFPTISTSLILSVASIFLDSGPMVLFYKFSAYAETYMVGYYYMAQVMTATNRIQFSVLAAGGIILTFITLPFVYGVKFLLEKLGPKADY